MLLCLDVMYIMKGCLCSLCYLSRLCQSTVIYHSKPFYLLLILPKLCVNISYYHHSTLSSLCRFFYFLFLVVGSFVGSFVPVIMTDSSWPHKYVAIDDGLQQECNNHGEGILQLIYCNLVYPTRRDRGRPFLLFSSIMPCIMTFSKFQVVTFSSCDMAKVP